MSKTERTQSRRVWSPHKVFGVLAMSALIATGLFGSGRLNVEATAAPPTTAASTAPHILLIVEENRSYSNIVGSKNAPYLNSLAHTYRSATNWYAVQHKSQDDYVELISGSNHGIPNGKPYAALTVVDNLHAKGIPWKAYYEGLGSDCMKGTDPTGQYDVFHNPFHYFTRYGTTTGKWCSSANLATEGVVRYPGASALVSVLDGSGAPDLVTLIPNDCHDMHGDLVNGNPCYGVAGTRLVTAGDTWLSANLPPILKSSWFAANGTVIITWDEGTPSDKSGCCGGVAAGGHIPTIVISSTNAGGGTFISTGDHYGTLRAIEEAYGVPLLLNSANTINGDLAGAFG
jgi:hypothetical protein